jgi:type I restriction enzyme S subunit
MRETLVKTEEFKDSLLGRIPKDWELYTLGECVRPDAPITYGIVQAGSHVEGGVPYIRTGDMAGDRLSIEGLLRTSPQIAASYRRSEVRTGEIVCAIRATVGKVLEVPPELDGANLTQGTARIAPGENINNHFLLWALRSSYTQRQFDLAVKGTTFSEITLENLRKIYVVLPSSRDEQDRIAEILDTIDSAIAHTSSLIAKLKQMKARLLHDLLTRGLDEKGELRDAIGHPEQFKDSPLGQIPKDWEVLPLQNFTLSSAFGPRFSGNAYAPDGNVATLRTTDMDDEGNLNLSTMPLARLNLDLYRSHFLEISDLLVSRSGTCGITAVFPGFDIPVIPGAFVIRFRFKNGLLSEFIRRYFNWETGRERVLREAEGGVQKNLRGSTLLKLLIPVPIEAEQREILRRLDAHESRIRTEEAYRDKLKLQKQGLMHDLLTGKVRVKDADKFTPCK